MAYNTKPIVTDKEGNPISQYYNRELDQFEPVEGSSGANKVIVEDNSLSLIPILNKLSQLTGTVIDEETRKSNETQRIDNEDTRQSNENIRNVNEIDRVDEEDGRVQNEIIRNQNESTRQANEQNRIYLYNDLMDKVLTGYFNGKNLEFSWSGTSLGVRVEGETDYIYVDLKGDTGDIANLTAQHIINALGYSPWEYSETTIKDVKVNKAGDSDTVGGFTVGVDVPANANFSNTTYSEITEAEIDAGNASTLRTISGRRIGYLLSKVSDLMSSAISGLMPKSGGVLENYREKLVTLSGTAPTINLSQGNVFAHTLTGNTTYTISNAVNNQAHSFTLLITQGSIVRTIIFPASIKWAGKEIPDLSEPNTEYTLTFLTKNGGANWIGYFGGGA